MNILSSQKQKLHYVMSYANHLVKNENYEKSCAVKAGWRRLNLVKHYSKRYPLADLAKIEKMIGF